jgi:hypothetical protein
MQRKKFSKYSVSRLAAVVALLGLVGAMSALASAQTESILHRFNPTTTDGNDPGSGLIADKAGNLYGTTRQGGTEDCGIAYELTPPAPGGSSWMETILHDFAGGTDGCLPIGALAMDKNGNLFGTTAYGGEGVNENSNGTVFELTPASGGSWSYAVIASFDSGVVAVSPTAQLVIDTSGNLYGTSNGGINNFTECGGSCGNIFELQPPTVAGGTWIGASIYNFQGGTTDGFGPSGLALGPEGVIYGTTGEGGPEDYGTFFKLTAPTAPGAWTERVVYLFTSANSVPFGNLVAGTKGNYFGTSEGPYPLGAVYELFPPSAGKGWTESILHTFTGGSDGSSPSGVIADRFGNLYGVNNFGGTSNNGNCLTGGCGAVYELSPPAVSGEAWTETTLHDFIGGYDGGNPIGPVVLVKGMVFGTTSYGGTPKYGLGGTVFRVMP